MGYSGMRLVAMHYTDTRPEMHKRLVAAMDDKDANARAVAAYALAQLAEDESGAGVIGSKQEWLYGQRGNVGQM